MSYTKTNWVNGETALSDTNMNHIENGIKDAHDALDVANEAIEDINEDLENIYTKDEVYSKTDIDTQNGDNFVTSDMTITASSWSFSSETPHILTKAGRLCYANFGIERSSAQTIAAGAKVIVGTVPEEFIPLTETATVATKIIKHNTGTPIEMLDAEEGIDTQGNVFVKNWGSATGDLSEVSIFDLFYVSKE